MIYSTIDTGKKDLTVNLLKVKEILLPQLKDWAAENPEATIRGESGKLYNRTEFLELVRNVESDGKIFLQQMLDEINGV